MKNPNCYTCKFRGEVAGSAHSSCKLFIDGNVGPITLRAMMSRSSNPTGILLDDKPAQNWNKHGIENGWVIFPYNFDPVWLEECKFHTPNESTDETE